MSYIEKTRQKDESEPVFFKQTRWQYFKPALTGLVALVVMVLFVVLLKNSATLWVVFTLLLVLLWVLGWLGYIWLRRKTTEYAVTNMRVVVKTGIIRRDSSEVRRGALESVSVSQGILGRILNYGDCVITGRGMRIPTMKSVVAPLVAKRRIEEMTS